MPEQPKRTDFFRPARPSPRLLELRLKRGTYKYELEGLYKQCSGCKEFWPADSDFFYIKHGAQGDGLQNYCRACLLEAKATNRTQQQIEVEAHP